MHTSRRTAARRRLWACVSCIAAACLLSALPPADAARAVSASAHSRRSLIAALRQVPLAVSGASATAQGSGFVLDGLNDDSSAQRGTERTRRPLVGILSQPLPDDTSGPFSGSVAPRSYIAASYVKFVEAGGARAVPLRYDAPPGELKRLFTSVNALLLPGGSGDISDPASPLRAAGQFLFDLASDSNAAGDFFPIHGTCLGFEQLAVLLIGGRGGAVLSAFHAKNTASAVRWTPAAETSDMFGKVPWLRSLLADPARNLTFENHQFGVEPSEFGPGSALGSALSVLATSSDRDGKEYVAAFEGIGERSYVSGTQWHPEKNLFEWAPQLDVPRGSAASAATQYMADWLVARARRSAHAPASEEAEEDMLIYNWSPQHARHSGSGKGAALRSVVMPEDAGAVAGGVELEPAATAATSGGGGIESVFDQVYVFPAWSDSAGAAAQTT